MRFVVDASVAVEYLLRTPLGLHAAEVIEAGDLLAPSLVDVEVLSILRRAVLRGALEPARAMEALEDLHAWPLERLPAQDLIFAAWKHRHNVSAYDAFYVAAARLSGATLITADGPLSRAPSLDILVHNLRL